MSCCRSHPPWNTLLMLLRYYCAGLILFTENRTKNTESIEYSDYREDSPLVPVWEYDLEKQGHSITWPGTHKFGPSRTQPFLHPDKLNGPMTANRKLLFQENRTRLSKAYTWNRNQCGSGVAIQPNLRPFAHCSSVLHAEFLDSFSAESPQLVATGHCGPEPSRSRSSGAWWSVAKSTDCEVTPNENGQEGLKLWTFTYVRIYAYIYIYIYIIHIYI